MTELEPHERAAQIEQAENDADDESDSDPIVTQSELEQEMRDAAIVAVLIAYFAMLGTVGALMHVGAI